MSVADKYDRLAAGWDEEYADPERYWRRRAELVVGLGPELAPGDLVLELACGDAALAEPLLARGFGYGGVDASPRMVEAAAARLAGRAPVALGDLNTYRPPAPVAATVCFRAFYYAADRVAFFRAVADYTERKLVFDFEPRRYRRDELERDLRAAGFAAVHVRPFLVPMRRKLPPSLAALLEAAERVPPLARLLLAFRFSYVCAASTRDATARS